jgi:phosphate starvation-inducible PhoH-like protein
MFVYLVPFFAVVATRSPHAARLVMRATAPREKSLALGYFPKTDNQRKYNEYLQDENSNIVICCGPAGSGKTALACHYAIEKYKQGVFKKIVITRPIVTVEEDIGFLPGTINRKMEPWTRPMMDIFNEYYPMTMLNEMLKVGTIEISPLAFMRGRTFKNAIIIADEMQNSSPNQMLMITTRIGDGSKMIITGDLKQTDLPKSGLADLITRYRNFSPAVANITDNVKLVEMSNVDIVRHPVVSKMLDLYSATEESVRRAKAAAAPRAASMEENIVLGDFECAADFMRGGGMDAALISARDQARLDARMRAGVAARPFERQMLNNFKGEEDDESCQL